MKKLLPLFFLFFNVICLGQQLKIEGAYKQTKQGIHSLLLVKDGYASETRYKDNAYLSTRGGPFEVKNGKLLIALEYSDNNKDEIGSQVLISLQSSTKMKPIRQDLDALWRITGRLQNGVITEIPRTDRKTIKILVDGYFQWIAINPAEKGFYGTGGGQYHFTNNKYQEKILFFSRDNTRVGQQLSFDGVVNSRQWTHSGLSSKGDPIKEIWSKEIN